MSHEFYDFYLLRYFPFPKTEEFLNIGIILKDADTLSCLFLKQHHLNVLDGCEIFSRFIIERLIVNLHCDLRSFKSDDELFKFLQHGCRNSIQLSSRYLIRSDTSLDESLEDLYNQYIGNKFEPITAYHEYFSKNSW